MHPALAFAGTHGPQLASWLLAHAGELGDAFARLSRPVTAAVTDPAALDRIGSALVAQRNGQTEVIGLLHQHTTKFDGIAAAIDGVGAGQQALDGSSQVLPGLHALSKAGTPADFHAVTTGANGRYAAGPGYDLVTGLSTPRADALVPALEPISGSSGEPRPRVSRSPAVAARHPPHDPEMR